MLPTDQDGFLKTWLKVLEMDHESNLNHSYVRIYTQHHATMYHTCTFATKQISTSFSTDQRFMDVYRLEMLQSQAIFYSRQATNPCFLHAS